MPPEPHSATSGDAGRARSAVTWAHVPAVIAVRLPRTWSPPAYDDRMRLTRKPDRGVADRAELDAFLDEQFAGVLATVEEGRPHVIPIAYVRDGDRILMHGSTGAGALRMAAEGAPVSFCVHAIDALRLSYNGLHHSLNYRSAVIEGTATKLTDDEHWTALDLFVDLLVPGRNSEIVPVASKDAARTMTLALPIVEDAWLMKRRSGEVARSEEAPDDVWMGTVPLSVVAGDPVAAVGQDPALPVPASVRRFVSAHRPGTGHGDAGATGVEGM